MLSLDDILAQVGAQTVLCVGDVMLDEFIYGDVSRISPEAATPVIQVTRQEAEVGGAGNVARNIAALGARCIFVGVVGDDEEGRKLARDLDASANMESTLVVDPTRPTTHKIRFVSEHHSTHLLRADWEVARPIPVDIETAVIGSLRAALPRADAVVLSDYAKGMLTPAVLRAAIDGATAAGKPVIVDPKGQDFSIYRGATLITPNRKELAEATRSAAKTAEEIAQAAAQLSAAVGSEAVLVTRSEDGMTLHVNGARPVHVPAYPVRVRDMSGAGDTVAAVLGILLAMGAGYEPAMRAANAAASVVVGKRGTAAVSLAELRQRLLPQAATASQDKIVSDASSLDRTVAEWRRMGLRVGFANGCFDLLHPGHVRLLAEARAACDRLIVGINSDASVAAIKGPERPLQTETARCEVLAALEAVDLVVVFAEPTPLEVIRRIRPSVLVKGSDWRREDVVGRDLVEADGGEVLLVDLVPGHSTTALVAHSRRGAA